MLDLISAIKDWPVIVQGALGSALFSLIVLLGQKFYRWSNRELSKFSRNNRKSSLVTERIKLRMRQAPGVSPIQFAPILLFRMSRPFIKAFIWLALGLLLGQLFSTLSVVGYVGSIYYLLKALDVVNPYNFHGDAEQRIAEIEKELKELEDIDA